MSTTAAMTPGPRIPKWRLQDRLLRSIDAAGVTVQEMADILGVSRTTVSNYLHGRTRPPMLTTRVWAMRTGVPLRWLVDGDEGAEGDTAAVTLWELVADVEQLAFDGLAMAA